MQRAGARFCKLLPPPDSFVLSTSKRKANRDLCNAAKRRLVLDTAKSQYDVDVLQDDTLWAKLGVRALALPAYLRPGKHMR